MSCSRAVMMHTLRHDMIGITIMYRDSCTICQVLHYEKSVTIHRCIDESLQLYHILLIGIALFHLTECM